MANVNINRNVDDAFYRYKMPRLIAKVEGKGNGIKTVIVNMPEIAKALNRPPTYPTKYFGCELGAQTQFDTKNDRFIVNGDHDQTKLQTLLDGFIRKFVLCPECENPETTLTIRKNQINQSCKACGHAGIIDQRHKLSTFILKNPPTEEAELVKAEKIGTKKKGTSSPTEETPTNGFDDPPGSNEGSDAPDNDDWAVDPEAAEERQKEISANMAGLTINADLEKSESQRLDMLYAYLKDVKDKTKGNLDVKAIYGEAERLDLQDKAPLLLCNLFFDKNIIAQVKTYRTIFLKFCFGNPRAQKYLLGGLEQLFAGTKETLLLVPRVLKECYDADLLEEAVLLDWGSKSSGKYVDKKDSKLIHQKAEPFLKWLKEAEEEESDESEDDGLEVVYENNLKPNGTTAPPVVNGVAVNGRSDEAHDLNIDDI